MSRIAVIIESSNVKGQKDLPGARKDATNWKGFLQKTYGGAWDANEIISLSKPTIADVEHILNYHRDKYLFVTFSGHGYEEKKYEWQQKGTPKILLNDNEKNIDLNRLFPRGNKGTLISDACRGHEVVALERSFSSVLKEASDSLSLSAESHNVDTRKIFKEIWLGILKNSPSGIVKMYSCGSDEGAEEDPEAGGIYTNALITSAKSWYDKLPKYWYTTRDAHNDAQKYMKKYFSQQNPEYSPENIAFPFAVSANILT